MTVHEICAIKNISVFLLLIASVEMPQSHVAGGIASSHSFFSSSTSRLPSPFERGKLITEINQTMARTAVQAGP